MATRTTDEGDAVTEHEHDQGQGLNGVVEPQGPQIIGMPAEVQIQALQNKLAAVSVDVFMWQATAEFQSELIKGLQKELGEKATEISKIKGEKDPEEQGQDAVKSE
jgi:hypothetical protein